MLYHLARIGDKAEDPPSRLLGTKFEVPALPASAIARPKMTSLLDATPAPFIAFVAGPGWGKTVSVRQWLDTQAEDVAWLSLDEFDTATTSFWRYTIESVRRIIGPRVNPSAAMLGNRMANESGFLPVFLMALEAHGESLTIVLDDLHQVRSEPTLNELRYLIEHLPANVRLVVTSRSELDLPISRWRLEGRAAEVRQQHLRFDIDEARSLFAQLTSVDLDPEDVANLVELTEGWAAGLQLASLALEGRDDVHSFIRSTLADDRVITDYLLKEVLDRLSPDDRDLVLRLSIVDSFDGDEARAISDRGDAPARVRSLQAGNLLVQPVDDGRRRLRFHPLLRELLQRELHWRHPDLVAVLHRRAADLYQASGRVAAAIDHRLAAGQLVEAYQLVAGSAWENLDRGDPTGARLWLDRFPAEFIEADVERILDFIILLSSCGRFDEALYWCQRAADQLAAPADEATRVLRARLMVAQSFAHLILGNDERAALSALHAVDLLADVPLAGWTFDRTAGLLTRLGLYSGNLAAAEHWLLIVRETRTTSPVVRDVLPDALAAHLALLRGDLEAAERYATTALANASNHGILVQGAVIEALTTLASTHLEQGRLAEADSRASRAVELARALGFPLLEVRSRLVATEIAAARFGPAAGLSMLTACRDALDGLTMGPLAMEWLAAAECRLFLAHDRLEGTATTVSLMRSPTHRRLLEARAALIGGRFTVVYELLAHCETWAVPPRIEALLLLARATRGHEATGHLRKAAALGVPRGYRRVYFAEGPDLLRIARRAQVESPTAEVGELLRIALGATTDDGPSLHVFVEPLTEREQALLDLLPTHLTYREMADHLCVSINTVKTYQKNVFRKLSVPTRSDAVATARAAGLLAS